MRWYFDVLKKYAVFSGRARRKEYWMFLLVNTIVVFVLMLIVMALGTAPTGDALNVLVNLYSLAVLVPGLAVGVRRLHDIGRSGWWLLISFIPVVGALVLLFFLLQDSDPGENQYGSNPKIVAV